MDNLFAQAGSWLGILGSVGLMLLGHVVRKYVIPFLGIGERQKYASYIATIADDIIDELRFKYPEKAWLGQLDSAVDKLIEICGISRSVADRAVRAAAARK